MTAQYGFGTTVQVPYQETIPRLKEALRAEGFGVLTEIDVRRTLLEKLGVEMEPYLILGACTPDLARRALEQEPEIGFLLPCNVVGRLAGSRCRIEIADPEAMVGMVGNEQLDAIAGAAEHRLQRVIAVLEGQAGLLPVHPSIASAIGGYVDGGQTIHVVEALISNQRDEYADQPAQPEHAPANRRA